MILLNILGAIVAVVLLIVVTVLLLPVDVLFLADSRQGLRLRYRFLGKLYGETPDPKNPLVRWVKQAVGLSAIGDLQVLKDEIEQRGRITALADLISALMAALDRIFWLLRHCRIARLRVKSVSGGEEAAIEYGAMCAVIYPLAGYCQRNGRLKERHTELLLRCDYEAQSSYDVELAVRVTVMYAVCALLHAMIGRAKSRRAAERKETANGTP